MHIRPGGSAARRPPAAPGWMAAQLVAVLSVAGSDSSGGAGIQADQRAFLAFGVTGRFAVTAVTAQGPAGVVASHPVPPEVVEAQVDQAVAAGRPAAVKTGMLASAPV